MNMNTLLGLTVLSCLSLVVRAKVRPEKKFLSFDFWPRFRRRFRALVETFDVGCAGGPGGEVGVWWWPWWWMVRHWPKLLQPHALLWILPGTSHISILPRSYNCDFNILDPDSSLNIQREDGLSVRPVSNTILSWKVFLPIQREHAQSCEMSQIWQIYLCKKILESWGKKCRRPCSFVKWSGFWVSSTNFDVVLSLNQPYSILSPLK